MTMHAGLRRSWNSLAWICLTACAVSSVRADTANKNKSFAVLDQFSEAVQALSARVTSSVVQISATRFAPRQESSGGRLGVVMGMQQSIGSGLVVDSDGYIITNAHVVEGAHRIRVSMAAQPGADSAKPDQLISAELAQAFGLDDCAPMSTMAAPSSSICFT